MRLNLAGGLTIAGKNITLNGTGFGNNGALPQGALVNLAGTNTWTGNIALAGSCSCRLPAPSRSLASTNTGTLIGATTPLNVTGVVSGTDLTKVGVSTVTLANINTYTGKTTVLGGTLFLSNTNVATGAATVSGMSVGGAFTAGGLTLNLFGTLPTSAIAIGQGGTLTLDNSVVNIVGTSTLGMGRLSSLAAKPNLTFNSGSFTFLANNAANIASGETVGTIALQSGQSTINSGFAAAASPCCCDQRRLQP